MSNFPWPDVILVAIVLFSAYTAIRRGFVAVLLSLVGFLVALFLAFNLFGIVGQWLTNLFGWSPIWSKPIAFIAIWIIVEAIFGVLEAVLSRYYGYSLRQSQVNRALAIIPGAAQ